MIENMSYVTVESEQVYQPVTFMCHLRFPPGLQYEATTFELLLSFAFLWFMTNVSGLYIRPIFRVQFSVDPEDGTNIQFRNIVITEGKRHWVATQKL